MTLATPSTSRGQAMSTTPFLRTTAVNSPTPISSTPRTSHPASMAKTPASVGQQMPPLLRSSHATPAHQGTVRTPSPNYFGLSVDAKDAYPTSAMPHSLTNWSPPSSNVRSTAAASPRIVPLDQNPEFDAFRRASEANSNGFNFQGRLGSFSMAAPPKGPRPTMERTSSKTPGLRNEMRPPTLKNPSSLSNKLSLYDETQKSPKRQLSSPSPNITDRPRRNSPTSFTERPDADQVARFLNDDAPSARMSVPPVAGTSPPGDVRHRAETAPLALDGTDRKPNAKSGGPEFVTPQHVVSLIETQNEDILLLDLRVSTQYARGRISGALNLCIPTTLLKRPSFNVAKLAETFKEDDKRLKFQNWKNCHYIIVYDQNSAQLKDATSCVNALKKFENEGWSGASYIIRGGFQAFAKNFSSLIVDDSSDSARQSGSESGDGELPSVAPVIGGCPMPVTKSAANPFFGNIRQNMDLIGGVGQISLKIPSGMTTQLQEDLPKWLKSASDEANHGKDVADKFLHIEQREQKRMQEALSGNVTYGTPGPNAQKSIQIAGIEKGSKNRYNNIWPYEHSRVKLQGKAQGDCDYVNANHVKSAWSNKRYIATQGPIPTTFADFWSVVWQQDVRVIVMLTAEKEGGQVKAHNYWEDKQYGAFNLHFLSEHRASLEPSKIHRHKERPSAGRKRSTTSANKLPEPEPASPSSDQPYVVVRRFALSYANEPFERMREITQLQYSNWPDFGAPAHPAHLLGLVEQCDAVVRSQQSIHSSSPVPADARPILVHCSAGCGRTGTFCTVDTVIDILKRQRISQHGRRASQMDVDGDGNKPRSNSIPNNGDASWLMKDDTDLIEKTVEEFRLQRLSMVQSLRQFALCYESVLEWLVEQQPRTA